MKMPIGTIRSTLLLSACSALLLGCGHHEGDGAHSPELGTENQMTETHHVHHGIDYIEFGVTDMEQSKGFYSAAFGWEFNDYGPEYAGIKKEGGEAGGLRLDAEVTRGGPLVILYSSELEASFAKVREAGAVITKEPFEFPGGRRFQFLDPSGNELAVWSEN